MKNKFRKILAVSAAALFTMCAAPVLSASADLESAEEIISDGSFIYDKVDGGYTIKRCTATIITSIPGVVNGTPVVEISEGAFSNCAGITELNIPKSVKKIGAGAFTYCTSLQKITIPSSVTEIPDQAFLGCSYLTDIELPDTITSIGDSAFAVCSSLTDIELPDSLTEIGDMAFNCAPLTNIDAEGCGGFVVEEKILYDKSKKAIYRAANDIAGDVYIADSVETIGGGAFSLCYGIENIFVPSSVQTIGDNCFRDCVSLKKLDFAEGLSSIGVCAFINNIALETVEFPVSLQSIGDSAFMNCTSLNKAIFQDGLKSIGANAFYDCEKLMQVSIPKTVETIGEDAFGKISDEEGNTLSLSGFKMNVSSGSAAEKYAKSADIEHTASDKSLKKMAFIIIAVGLIIAVIIFAIVLMARNRKGAAISAKKAQKEAKEKEAEENYVKILDDSDEHKKDSDKKNSNKKKSN
jgi:leucine-rich repeat-containing protein